MKIDCHCHLFLPRIIENCAAKSGLIEEIKLDVEGARDRIGPEVLEESAARNGIDACILMPTAMPGGVKRENDRHLAAAAGFSRIESCATLHPEMKDMETEITRVLELGAAGFKFSSFSQRFDLSSKCTARMFELIQKAASGAKKPAVVLDTFTKADVYFGADHAHVTTPRKLAMVVERFPEINFVGAHMGGLAADFKEIVRHLKPAPNLYLDTSNATHTLEQDEFRELVEIHGTGHVMFGTDWPWFGHEEETGLMSSIINSMYEDGSCVSRIWGFNSEEVFNLTHIFVTQEHIS